MDNSVQLPTDDDDLYAREASTSVPVDTDGSEDSYHESSNEDSDENESDYIASESDEEFWTEDAAANAWLARNPGGMPHLYPQLFVVKPRRGRIETLSRHSNRNDSLLNLPSEIRNRIYTHYFDRYEESANTEEDNPPFQDREGQGMESIRLSSENVELKFWLSTAILQTSRQVRSEAMSILFGKRVITAEWLPCLSRFVDFLGIEGCGMVRHLDIWDTLNFQEHNTAIYRDVIASIAHFPCLQHLRIVLSWGTLHGESWTDRIRSWFDTNEWTDGGTLKRGAAPKIRSEHIETHWQEYEILKNLKARKFTLAVGSTDVDEYLEFDRHQGVYPEIVMAMQGRPTPPQSIQSSASATASASPQVLDAFEVIAIQTDSRAFTPSSEPDDEDFDHPAWQDTDTLANKTIPLYNYLREFFHLEISPGLSGEEMLINNFITFPTARKSTGSIMRDCAMCYQSDCHCGYHAVPDQLPYKPHLLGDTGTEYAKILETRFKNLSYLDMRNACRHVVELILDPSATELYNTFKIFDHRGWFKKPNGQVLARLDAAVEVGWTGEGFDKQEVPPWDILYRELLSKLLKSSSDVEDL